MEGQRTACAIVCGMRRLSEKYLSSDGYFAVKGSCFVWIMFLMEMEADDATV
jgi:hypothetical protein